jgi:hypothetical protein
VSQLQRKVLFPTPVYFKDIPNSKELNKYLLKHGVRLTLMVKKKLILDLVGIVKLT